MVTMNGNEQNYSEITLCFFPFLTKVRLIGDLAVATHVTGLAADGQGCDTTPERRS
jgi:hypothetical protein